MTRTEASILADHYEEMGDTITSAWLRKSGRYPPAVTSLKGDGSGYGGGNGSGNGRGSGRGSGYGRGNGYGSGGGNGGGNGYGSGYGGGYGGGNGSGYGGGNGSGNGSGNGRGYGGGYGGGNGSGGGYGSGYGGGGGYGSGYGYGGNRTFIKNKEIIMPKPGQYVVVRADKDGCKCGYYVTHNGPEVVLRNARVIWNWEGQRLSLIDVTVVPGECRLSRPSYGEVIVLDACGIIEPSPEVEEFLKTQPGEYTS